MIREEKRLLRILRRLDPEKFNNLEYDRKFICFIAVFNEYIKKVAIPKNWDFTKTIKHWPDGTGEGEGITKDGKIWYTDEKNTLLQHVLDYPDLGLFAMENYGLVIDTSTCTADGESNFFIFHHHSSGQHLLKQMLQDLYPKYAFAVSN